MTTVRIAHAEPRPGRQPGGRFMINSFLVVLADDAGGRALPIYLRGADGHGLWQIVDPSAAPSMAPGAVEQETVRLLRTADVDVRGVDIDELDPAVTKPLPAPHRGRQPPRTPTARIEFASAGGAPHIMATRLGYALALAAGSGAPIRVGDAEMDRLAVPVRGDDLLGPFREEMASEPQPPDIPPRFEPRNLAFADGLAGWEFGGSFRDDDAVESHGGDFICAADDGSALLSSAVPEPLGYAALAQTIFAEEYEGRRVNFGAEVRTAEVTGSGGLHLRTGIPSGPVSAPEQATESLAGSHGWARRELSAEIPDGAGMIQFGAFLRGRGRVELRNLELSVVPGP